MTILFYEGFDYINQVRTSTANSAELYDLSQRLIMTGSWKNLFSIDPGYNGIGNCVTISSSSSTDNSFRLPITNSYTSFCIGAHFNFTTSSAGKDIFTVMPVSGTNFIRLTTVSSSAGMKSLNLVINNVSNVITLNFEDEITYGQWQHITLQGQVTSTNQVTINLYVNDMLAATWSGTGFTTTPYSWNRFFIGMQGGNGSSAYSIDNLYLTDGERLGLVEVRSVYPTGDTAQAQGIPAYGPTRYNMSNVYTNFLNTSYTSFVNNGDSDAYNLGDLSLDSTYQVLAAQCHGTFRKSPVTDMISGRVSVKSGGIESGSTEATLDATNYVTVSSPISLTDPATSLPWDLAGINNMQISVGRTAGSAPPTPSGFYIDSGGLYPTTVGSSTIIAGDTAPTVSSGALVFNGSQNIRYTDDAFWHVVPDYSVEFEFYTSSTSTNQCIATVGGNVQVPQWPEWTIFIGSNNVTFYSNSDATSGGSTTTANFFTSGFAATTWYKLGFMIYSSGTYRVRGYINDVQSFDVPIAGGTIGNSSFGFAIGGDAAKDSGRQFTGGVRNFRMANSLYWTV